MKRFIQPNIINEKNISGVYFYYNKNQKRIYTGVGHKVRDRLLAAYYSRADYAVVKSKIQLRKQIAYYDVVYKIIKEARKHEHRAKPKLKYNKL
jgi:hypothetical protein